MRILLLHLRISKGLLLFPVLLIVVMTIIFSHGTYWIGVWPATGAAAQIPAMFMSVLAAALAAWISGSEKRYEVLELVSAAKVSRRVRESYSIVALLTYVIGAYLFGHVVAMALTVPSSPPGFELWIGYFFMGFTPIIFGIAIGWMTGKVLSSLFASVVSGFGWLIFMLYLGVGQFGTIVGHPFEQVEIVTVLVHLAAAMSVCALSVLIPPLSEWNLKSMNIRHGKPLAMVAVLAVALGGVWIQTDSPIQDRELDSAALCSDGDIEICLWPEHEKYMTDVEEIAERANQLPEELQVIDRIEEYGISYRTVERDGIIYSPHPDDAEPVFRIPDGSTWAIGADLAHEILGEILEPCVVGEPLDERMKIGHSLQGWLEGYLAGGGARDFSTDLPPEMESALDEGIEQVGELSKEQQFEWALDQIEEHGEDRLCV